MPESIETYEEALRRATKREEVRQRLYEERRQSDDDRILHELRSAVLEVATQLEAVIEAVIASHYARTYSEGPALRLALVSRMNVPDKLNLLRQIMESTGSDQLFPFVLPIVKEVFEVRNTLAHAVFRGLDDGGHARFGVMRRSAAKVETLSLTRVRALAWHAQIVVEDEMWFVWAYATPHKRAWHEG